MHKRYPNLQYTVLTEEDAIAATRDRFTEREWRLVYVLDDLIKLPFFLQNNLAAASTDQGAWQSYCSTNYQQAPYTLNNIYQLWRRAYYLESLILARHLLEVFVQMRYFERHLDKLMPHQIATRRKDRVTFKDMFEELSSNSYNLIYSNLLSAIAHGNLNLVFRATITNPTPTSPELLAYPIAGCKFDETQTDYNYILIASIALGFLNYFAVIFPCHTVTTDREFSEHIADHTQWLKDIFDRVKALVPDPKMMNALEQIITP